jgi:hypothetical protein
MNAQTTTTAPAFRLDRNSEAAVRLQNAGYEDAAIILRDGHRLGTVHFDAERLEYVAYADGERDVFTSGERFDAAAKLVESLPAPVAPSWTTIPAQDMKPGYRYWSVRPGYESNWTIKTVEIAEASFQVDRGQGWFTPVLVTVTRRDGVAQTHEYGDEVAIQGPWKTV